MKNKEIVAGMLASAIYQKTQPKNEGVRLTPNADKGGAPGLDAEIKIAADLYEKVLAQLTVLDQG